jgi:hypothetical protein
LYQESQKSLSILSTRRKRYSRESAAVNDNQANANQRANANHHRGLSASAPATVTASNLLGNFEESVLNGRLEPVSTVAGFTAEIGASGSFHPKHMTLPVTVFFYTLCDNSNVSSPYLGKFIIAECFSANF